MTQRFQWNNFLNKVFHLNISPHESKQLCAFAPLRAKLYEEFIKNHPTILKQMS